MNVAGEGNESVRSGKGRENNPIFVTSGVDTTVDNAGEGVTINRYSVYTGSCDSFSGDCKNSDGIRNSTSPATTARAAMARGCRSRAFSAAQLGGNLNFSYGNGSRLRLGAASARTRAGTSSTGTG